MRGFDEVGSTTPVRRLRRRLLPLFSAALAVSLFASPAAAHARRAASDVIAGVPAANDRARAAAAPDVDAATGILVGPDGRVLWSRGADVRRPMASTTKMMTALLAIEAGHLDKTVTVSRAASQVPYGIGLRAGERVTKRRLLELALVASSNDAAYALGEDTAGNMGRFVRMMNARAASLGLRDTRFANPHGLDAPGHYSSAADLAALARHVMSVQEFRRAVAMKGVSLPGRPGSLSSTDELLGRYRGLAGVKTGFTAKAGYSFVSMADRDGITLTAVVLGSPSNDARFLQSARLLDWGFAHTSRRQVTRPETVGKTTLAADPRIAVPLRVAEATSAVVVDLDGPVRRTVSVPPRVALPVYEGQPLGEVKVTQGDRLVARVPAVAATSAASVQETIGLVPVADYVDRAVPAVTRPAAKVPAFDANRPVTRRVELEPAVDAPIAAGDRVGEIVYRQGAKVVVRVPVVAAASVRPPGVIESLRISLHRGWLSLIGAPVTASLQVTTN